MRWSELLVRTTVALGDRQEARWLVEEASGKPLGLLLAGSDEVVGATGAGALSGLVARRLAGEPLQHVLGRWPFRQVDLRVDRRALVPRPETEILVGHGLDVLGSFRTTRGEAGEERPTDLLVALDLGTGSGAIACSLVREARDVRVVAVEVSPEALALAAENRTDLGTSDGARIELREGSWYEPIGDDLAGQVHLVISNPPYLARGEWDGLDPVVRDFDPYGALVAGETGLEAIEAVLAGAARVLRPGGAVVLELAPDQATMVLSLARAGGARSSLVHLDLAGRERCLVARW